MNTTPKSALEKVNGLMFLPRTLDKIRLHAKGELRPDFHAHMGIRGDGWCCDFLHVNYTDLKARVLAGDTDEQIFAWCQQNGRPLNDTDLLVWNAYVSKLGWNDFATPNLARNKKENGLAHRDDIITMLDFWEVDEGRRP